MAPSLLEATLMRRWLVLVLFLGACRGCLNWPSPNVNCSSAFKPMPPTPPPPKFKDLGVTLPDFGPPVSPCFHDGACYTIGDTCEVEADADVIQCTCTQWTFGGRWSCDPATDGSSDPLDASVAIDASDVD
jgi:hypothetical protein